MIVVHARPPLFAEIDAAFHVVGKSVLFAWGDRIFNPSGGPIAPELVAHEAVHGKRQLAYPGGVEAWWRRYIDDPQFRVAEEIPAHQAEYLAFCSNHVSGPARNARRMALHGIAKRLAGPLYGNLIGYDAARKLIKAAA